MKHSFNSWRSQFMTVRSIHALRQFIPAPSSATHLRSRYFTSSKTKLHFCEANTSFSLSSPDGIVAEAPPVADEARRGWRSGQNRSALQADKRFWEPQEGKLFPVTEKQPKRDDFLVHKLEFEIIHAYNVAFLYSFFTKSINDTA